MGSPGLPDEPRRLSDFLRERREEILSSWEIAVRRLRAARDLPRPLLIDHVPQFIDDLANYVDHLRAGSTSVEPPFEESRLHALERLAYGYDLVEVLEEYGILRECMTQLSHRSGSPAIRSAELPLLHRAIDRAISISAAHYAKARERTLRALDRISSIALASRDVESLLPGLLNAFLETTASADSVALVSRDDGSLRVRAAVGYPDPSPVGREVRPGAFSARVAREGALLLREAGLDPAIEQSPTHAPGTRARYGVPLTMAGEVLGSVVMGSRSSSEFSGEDQLLFRTMVNRAAELIAQARLRQEVARRAAEVETVIESMPALVFVGDEQGFRMATAAALDVIGARTPAEMTPFGQPGGIHTRRIEGGAVSPDEHVFLKALRGERATMQVRITHARTGKELVLQVSAAPIEMDGRIVGAVGVGTDITDRVRMEEELRAVLEFRDRMLGVLSHDLKNPLGVILASAHLLNRAPLDERQQRSLERLITNGRRIERMIRDLLDYTRARLERTVPIARRDVDMREVCKTAVDELQLLHPDRSLRLVADGDLTGSFDPDRVAQVVSNLVENAVRYGRPGSPIEVSLRRTDGEVLMEVHNDGEPIAPGVVTRIFEPFQRGAQQDGDGLGLGLYIVKHVVEAHGGSVEVRSGGATGTTFLVRWPRG